MVCKTCEKKLSKVAAPDPTRNRALTGSLVASGSKPGSSSVGKAVGGNKLLGAKNRYNPVSSRCKLCKQNVSQEGAQYCQGCAYKKGLCARCGKVILDTKLYKQSVV